MAFNLTVKSLEGWLYRPEYKPHRIQLTKEELSTKDVVEMEKHNRVLGRSFHHTFDKWFKKWKRIPTPQEFIAMQMEDVRKNFDSPAWRRNHRINFQLTPVVEKALKGRLLRSYVSFINELHTELVIKELYPKATIDRGTELDFEGIDLLVHDSNKAVSHKIHITKNSVYAIDFLFKKEGKKLEFRGYNNKLWAVPVWKKVNHAIYEDRDFSGHIFLLYNSTADYSTRVVNGYYLFTRDYIKTKLEANILRNQEGA